MSSMHSWLDTFPDELMHRVHQHLSPKQLLLLELATTPDPSWRHVSDEELELARVAQEEFELFDDSYYDDLYDGDEGLDGDEYDAQCFGCDRSDVLDEIAW
tara:strand:+ start:3004 stop:3306 length:303 start_codon:yes stop_codon:yes gene_type:complete